MAAPTMFFTEDRSLQLDDLLYEICEDLQLTRTRYQQAQERYKTLSEVLESADSPFRFHRPLIYPQGSMRLGTTVHPLHGPFDLDFVLQLSRSHREINPMTLLQTLFSYLKQHGSYASMVTLKNRCVRIEYANEFYMDVLPACLSPESGINCIKVPDRETKWWSDSNPVGYATWFELAAKRALLKVLMDRAFPVPVQQTVDQKRPLQLIVQLLKRWRDLYYKTRPELAPISIVLTTLAAEHYDGDECINTSLAKILSRICDDIAAAEAYGRRIKVSNPANQAEDLSERWDSSPAAYRAFRDGIWDLRQKWNLVLIKSVNVNAELENLFGETVRTALVKQAKRIQEARARNALGVKSSGILASSAAASSIPMRTNTYHGQK